MVPRSHSQLQRASWPAGPASSAEARGVPFATWGIAAYLALNTVGNLASTSDVERWAFGPATGIASALTAFVALRTRRTASA